MLLRCIFLIVLGISGCRQPSPDPRPIQIANLETLPTTVRSYEGKQVEFRAFLVSTRHGMYLTNAPHSKFALSFYVGEESRSQPDIIRMMASAKKRQRGESVYVRGTFRGVIERAGESSGWTFRLARVVDFEEVSSRD